MGSIFGPLPYVVIKSVPGKRALKLDRFQFIFYTYRGKNQDVLLFFNVDEAVTKARSTTERNTSGRQPQRVQKGSPELVQKGGLPPNSSLGLAFEPAF